LINNGPGFSVAVTLAEVGKIEQALMLLPDSAAIYEGRKRLVVTHNVLGSKVHDARLVAAMNIHQVRRILTFNTVDFARYEIEALHPASLISRSFC